jgi:hypothetical protein
MAKNYTAEQMVEAIRGSGGVVDFVAARLGCGWECARKYIDMHPEAQEAIEQERCKFHSQAYSKFHEAIKKGERWAIERILDTSGRRNGHGLIDHKQIDHTTNGESVKAIEVRFVDPDETSAG